MVIAMSNEHENGWFYGYSPTETMDENGKTKFVDSRNVVGRFVDHRIIDVPASVSAGRSMYKDGIVLETRALAAGMGFESRDIAAQTIRFDHAYADDAQVAIERFPDAWKAFQEIRKTAVTDDEKNIAGTESKPVKRKSGRPRKEAVSANT